MIKASTRLVGVIGWPVAHSRSPAMHNAALRALGLDWIYAAFAVPPERLAAAVAGAAALGFVGLNVTIPHKEAALALCAPDETARRVGAVNTLSFEAPGDVQGTNTDVSGFRMLLAEARVEVRGRRALLLGAGGAARAAALALLDDGAELTVVSRAGRPLAVGGHTSRSARWDDLPSLLAAADLLVDATPRGLDAAADALPLDALPPHAAVIDLVALPTTALVEAARARGLVAAAGLPMLLHQGARSLERWCGRPAPLEVMRAALAQGHSQVLSAPSAAGK